MLKRTITGIFIVAVVVGFFFLRKADVRLFAVLIYFLSLAGTFEVFRAVNRVSGEGEKAPFSGGSGKFSLAAEIVCAAAFTPVFVFCGPLWALAVLGCGVIALAAAEIVSPAGAKAFGARALVLLYPNAFLFCMLAVNAMEEHSLQALLLIFVTSPLSDTLAYLVGSLIGGKKLCPKISPNKTVEGAVGGILGSVLLGLVITAIYDVIAGHLAVEDFTAYHYLLICILAAVSSVLGILGDLFASAVKRQCGIKDYGTIFPGHGGVMDRFDSVMFIAPFLTIGVTMAFYLK